MVALQCFAGVPAFALIMTGTGNAPVSERAWPASSVKLVNLSARLGWWEGSPFGLHQPGARVALKLFVMLATGNEAGSAPMFVPRLFSAVAYGGTKLHS